MIRLTILLLAISAPAFAAESAGNLYLLGITIDQEGNAGQWTRVGQEGGWKTTLAGAIHNGFLYTVEANGSFWKTNLEDGSWQQLGKNDYGNTTHMFASGAHLYSIEKDGSLFQINPDNGVWSGVGKPGALKGLIGGAICQGHLFTVDSSGALWQTSLTDGGMKQIGKKDYANTAHLFSASDKLFTIEKNGTLYAINPVDGTWAGVGKPGDWVGTFKTTILRGQLYSVEKDGGMYSTNLKRGTWRKIGSNAFGATTHMFATDDYIYTIEQDGNLYRVFARPDQGLDAFNWCAEELEKVFREQGKPYYHTMESRQVLGAKVTYAATMEGFAWLKQKATAKDRVVIYIGAHGATDPKLGWSIMTVDEKPLWAREVKAALAKLSCPILLFIETCTSGGFVGVHLPDDPPVPANVTVLCACKENETTTNPLDIAVAEALYGRADYNHDGVIDSGELVRYTRARYVEMWPNPKDRSRNTPVIVESKMLSQVPLTVVSPQLAAVAYKNALHSALLENQSKDQCTVHFLGWSCKRNEPYFIGDTVPRNSVCLRTDGAPVLVEQGGNRIPARLLKQDGDTCAIEYLGDNRKETVPLSKIKFPFNGKELLGK